MVKMDSIQQRQKLDAVRHLKQEYGISSLAAWSYLKVTEDVEQLRKRLLPRLKGIGMVHLPTQREVANLMVNAASELEELFDFEAQRSVQHDSLHYALPLNKTISHPLHHAGEGERDERLWSIDHEAFLMTYFTHLHECRDEQEALRQTIRVVRESDHHFFYDGQERRSFPEFLNGEVPLAMKVEISCGEESAGKELDIKGLRGFDEWLSGKRGEHPLRKRVGNPKEDLTFEEHIFLYGFEGGDTYQRAVRERTLGRLATQRRIALHYSITTMGQRSSYQSREVVEEAEERCLTLLQRVERRVKRLKGLSAPQEVIRHEQSMVTKRRYILRAIKSNRSWLERVLSH